ncbi:MULTISPECIES: hypothetical protein [Salinibaculum]|uniref:hypothetical protein n=1 Tax=Salinibaculum TaxID=2732368 RepID=UPI0030CF6348
MMKFDTAENESSATGVAQLMTDIEAKATEQIESDGEVRLGELRQFARAHERFVDSPTYATTIIDRTDVYDPEWAGEFQSDTMAEELKQLAASALVEKVVDKLESERSPQQAYRIL